MSRRKNATLSQFVVDKLVKEIGDVTGRPRPIPEAKGCNEAETDFVRALLVKKPGARSYRHGWPDFLVEHEGKTFAIEVKRGPDVPSARQRAIFAALERGGLPVYIWNPAKPYALTPWSKYRRLFNDPASRAARVEEHGRQQRAAQSGEVLVLRASTRADTDDNQPR